MEKRTAGVRGKKTGTPGERQTRQNKRAAGEATRQKTVGTMVRREPKANTGESGRFLAAERGKVAAEKGTFEQRWIEK